MLECLPAGSPTFSTMHQAPMDASSSSSSPVTSTTTINLSRIYSTAILQTNSFKEMVRITSSMDLVVPDAADHEQDQLQDLSGMLTQVLSPNRDRVLNALHRSKSTSLLNLISSYFDYSERTTRLCLTLRGIVAQARRLYSPINTLLQDLPIDSLSQTHCELVVQEFHKFKDDANPFPRPDSLTFHPIRDHFCDLNRQLERRLRKSSSRIRLVRSPNPDPNTVLCCRGGAAITAYIPPKFARRELAYAAQLKVASRNTYVLKTDLDTLDSLVGRLHNTVEDDKRFIRLGLNMGNDEHTVQEVLIHLGKNHPNLGHYLDLLEQKITTCLITVNHSRSQLLKEILLHQTSSDSSHPQ
ncbi:hypothetical protein IC582_013911 [Cucumis melo]|uniref:UPF0496 protein At3g19330 isoform X1 n=2 Tax=Cucumis melo TaxID=3656 RepID=A0A1S3BP81_CUCME|nr:UPF0496 protein At3g19330 isoform X1 [Cucumis melo]